MDDQLNTRYVDLHCHSSASDGTFAPAEVVRFATEANLSALALTDHDTVAGLGEAASAAGRLGIDFLPGIEISCEYPHPGTMHLLGYGIDPDSAVLKDLTARLIAGRDNRNPKIIARLNELNVAITMQEVEAEAARNTASAASGAVIGRPHIAAVLLRKGYVNSIKHAFDKYLGTTGLAYFDKERLTSRQAIDLVHRSGGLPVLAHPCQLRTNNDAELERVIKDLVDLGLAGLEVIHSDHDGAMVDRYARLAERYGLLKTGGSDFHGANKADIQLGLANGRRVPRDWFDALRDRLGRSPGTTRPTSPI